VNKTARHTASRLCCFGRAAPPCGRFMTTYHVGLIGLGAIASGYSQPEEEAPYTHAGGIFRSNRVQLAAACDLSSEARQGFYEKWTPHLPPFETPASVEELLGFSERSGQQLSIIAVCVRGPFHFSVLQEVLAGDARVGLRSIFLEKPPTCSLAQWDETRALASAAGVSLTVSYSRHWAPHLLEMSALVQGGLIGRVHTVVGFCGQGVLSFASHTTDLLCQFAGSYEPLWVEARAKSVEEVPARALEQGFGDEPHLERLCVGFEGGAIGVQIGAQGDFGSFYADVWGDKGRVRVGMYRALEAFDLEGKPLELPPMPANRSVFSLAYEQIAGYLDGGALPDCSDGQAGAVHEIGFAAIESAARDGQRIHLPNAHRNQLIWANG